MKRSGLPSPLRSVGVFQADKESEFDDLCFLRIFGNQSFERVVHLEHKVVVIRERKLNGVHVDTFEVTAMFTAAAAARSIDEDSAHRFRGHGVELLPIFPFGLRLLREPEPYLMHEGGRLQGLARGFVGHFCRGDAAQFSIDEVENALGSSYSAIVPTLEDFGQFAHDRRKCE